MILFTLLIATAAAFDKDTLSTGLRSSEGQVRLFNKWMSESGEAYGLAEKNFRFRIFRENLKFIVAENEAQEGYTLDANFMAALTPEEQKQYYGINITALPVEEDFEAPYPLPDDDEAPTSGSKLWREEGKVAAVQNQGSCGSCWAFAGIAATEGHYAIATNDLKKFSEQEFVDCAYTSRDGCNGGWYWDAYNRVLSKQRLALLSDYRYTARSGRCQGDSKPNGLTGVKFTGTAKTSGDSALAAGLSKGPVAMAFEIKGGFNYYKSGVLSIHNCGRTPHHAMAVTGYTPEFWEIKNSWGSRWGDQGYVRFSRKINNMCGVSTWNAYPKLSKGEQEE